MKTFLRMRKLRRSALQSAMLLAMLLTLVGCDSPRSDSRGTESQSKQSSTDYAELSLPKNFDLGKLRKDETNNVRSIVIKNIGTAELVVGNFSSSCGCAFFATMANVKVSSGETKAIDIALQVSTPGARNATIRFETNDPRQPFATTTIQWRVESIISFGQDGWYAEVFPKAETIVATLPVISLHEDIKNAEETLVANFDPPIRDLDLNQANT